MAGKKGSTDKGKGKGKGKAQDDDQAESDRKAKGAQSINVRHILCEKHARKEEALARIRDGARFDEVAREMSEDKARQGGALGWKTRGDLDAAFEKVAFELEASTAAKPAVGECKSEHGYHIIMVEGRK